MTRAFELLCKYEQAEEERNSNWRRITSKVNEILLGFDKYLNDGGSAVATVKLGVNIASGFNELSVDKFRYEDDESLSFALLVSLNKASRVVVEDVLSLSCVRYHAGFIVKIEGGVDDIIVGGYMSDDTELFEAMYKVLESKFVNYM
ncbi:uncharacterized protein POS17_3542 [Pseudomonas sp. Os17]|uniref:hypothetical protein n=1 Tax=Pseudomonas sp. Os17 TaxID=1500686 RepID=UPI0005FC63CF|nr:hypothetical protein [Pseudomonas sp. Os17]BAQ75236.1 uncharacterized protein POS17_3542 [Pseudomonas sp. Os17]